MIQTDSGKRAMNIALEYMRQRITAHNLQT